MSPRTPTDQYGALFNFAGGGRLHMEIFAEEPPMAYTAYLLGLLLRGTHSERPAASAVQEGCVYAETDTGSGFQSDQTSWLQIWTSATPGTFVQTIEADGGGALDGDITLSPGTNIALNTTGNDIEIAVTGITTPNPPGCEVIRTANMNVSNTTTTYIAFTSENYDNDSMHDNSTNNDRITINTTGRYLFELQIIVDPSSTADWFYGLEVNGSTLVQSNQQTVTWSPYGYFNTFSVVLNLTAGDYVRAELYQISTGTRVLSYNANHSPILTAIKLGDAP
jgi:hypothetical protein